MKSVALLTSMAAAVTITVGAQQLRGDWGEGIEEVGDAVLEHFPPDEYVVDRRILLNSNSDSEEVDIMAERIMEEYFVDGEGEGNDLILDEDHDYEFEPSYAGSLTEDEVVEWEYEGDLLTEDFDHSAVDVIGTVIEDEDDDGLFYWDEDEEPIVKDTAPEPDTTIVSFYCIDVCTINLPLPLSNVSPYSISLPPPIKIHSSRATTSLAARSTNTINTTVVRHPPAVIINLKSRFSSRLISMPTKPSGS